MQSLSVYLWRQVTFYLTYWDLPISYFVRHRCLFVRRQTFHTFDIWCESNHPILTKPGMHDPQNKGFQSCSNLDMGITGAKREETSGNCVTWKSNSPSVVPKVSHFKIKHTSGVACPNINIYTKFGKNQMNTVGVIWYYMLTFTDVRMDCAIPYLCPSFFSNRHIKMRNGGHFEYTCIYVFKMIKITKKLCVSS